MGVGPSGTKKLETGTFKRRAIRSRFSIRGSSFPARQARSMPPGHRMYSVKARTFPLAISSRYMVRLLRSESRAAMGSITGSIASRLPTCVHNHLCSSVGKACCDSSVLRSSAPSQLLQWPQYPGRNRTLNALIVRPQQGQILLSCRRCTGQWDDVLIAQWSGS